MTEAFEQHESAPFGLRFLTSLSKFLPPIRGVGSIGLYVIRPLWTRHNHGTYLLPIWSGVRMWVNPEECVGSILAFVPQLFDRRERKDLKALLPEDGVFVDVGANIGAYSLWAGRHCAPRGMIVAIEADAENFKCLTTNIAINKCHNIHAIRAGVGDSHELLTLYKNVTGNNGAHNFCQRGVPSGQVECFPLSDLLQQAGVNGVDFLKMDIEGLETKVLAKYFLDVPADSPLRPTFLLVEITGGPQTQSEKAGLRQLIIDNGYTLIWEGANAMFRRSAPMEGIT